MPNSFSLILDLFSLFDPAAYALSACRITFWWVGNFLFILLLVPTFYMGGGRFMTANRLFFGGLVRWLDNKQIHHLKGIRHIITASVVVVLSTNLIGQMPYTFPVSTSLLFRITLSLPMWLGLTLSAIRFAPYYTLTNFIPLGTPLLLTFIVAVAEFIRYLARPLSHCARLTINTSLGHLYLKIAASASVIYYTKVGVAVSRVFFVGLSVGLIFFEMVIALIQSYIFCFLLTIYVTDHPRGLSPLDKIFI